MIRVLHARHHPLGGMPCCNDNKDVPCEDEVIELPHRDDRLTSIDLAERSQGKPRAKRTVEYPDIGKRCDDGFHCWNNAFRVDVVSTFADHDVEVSTTTRGRNLYSP